MTLCNFSFYSNLENASQEEIDALRSELDQMIFVGKHPNVVSLLGACTKNGETNLHANFVITVDSSKFIHVKHQVDFHLFYITHVLPQRSNDCKVYRKDFTTSCQSPIYFS